MRRYLPHRVTVIVVGVVTAAVVAAFGTARTVVAVSEAALLEAVRVALSQR